MNSKVIENLSEDWKVLLDNRLRYIPTLFHNVQIGASSEKHLIILPLFKLFDVDRFYSSVAVQAGNYMFTKGTTNNQIKEFVVPDSKWKKVGDLIYVYYEHALIVHSLELRNPGVSTAEVLQPCNVTESFAVFERKGLIIKGTSVVMKYYLVSPANDTKWWPLTVRKEFNRFYFSVSQYAINFSIQGGTKELLITGYDSIEIESKSSVIDSVVLTSSDLPAKLVVKVNKQTQIEDKGKIILRSLNTGATRTIIVNKSSKTWEAPVVCGVTLDSPIIQTIQCVNYGTRAQKSTIFVKSDENTEINIYSLSFGRWLLVKKYTNGAPNGDTYEDDYSKSFNKSTYSYQIAFECNGVSEIYQVNVTMVANNYAIVNSRVLENKVTSKEGIYSFAQYFRNASFIVKASYQTNWLIVGEESNSYDARLYSDKGEDLGMVPATAPNFFFDVGSSSTPNKWLAYTGDNVAVSRQMIPYIGAIPFPQGYESLSTEFENNSILAHTTQDERKQIIERLFNVSFLQGDTIYPYILGGRGPLSLMSGGQSHLIGAVTTSQDPFLEAFKKIGITANLSGRKFIVLSWISERTPPIFGNYGRVRAFVYRSDASIQRQDMSKYECYAFGFKNDKGSKVFHYIDEAQITAPVVDFKVEVDRIGTYDYQ